MPKYKVNGRTFNIPDNEVDLFEADFPEAQLHYQTNDGRKFTIYANERKDFLSDFPDATELGWSETIKEQAKQADPFQPEDNLAQPMYGSMSYQDNIGKPEDSLYYPSPLSEEGRADYEPITAEERSKKEYDMLMRQLNDFDAQNRDFMDTYEAYEKAAKHQVNEGGFALDTMEREYVNANSNDYHLRKQERDALNERIRNNSYFNQMRMTEADAANEAVDAISDLMAQNEAENTELHKKMKAMNALAMNPRGSLSGFSKTKEMQEYVDERDDLLTAKRLYENTAQVYAAPINDGEDVLKKFGQGFVQRGDDLDFWTMGIVGIADDMNARAAFQKIQDKFGSVKEFANLTDAEIDALLTPSEQLLISAVMDNNAALYARKDNTAGAYKAGAGAADSLMFMAQFLLTGGVGDAATVGTAAHRRLVNWLGRKVGSMSNGLMKDVARGAVKLGVGTAESIGKALVMTPLMPHTYANIADKMMSFDDNGELMDTTDAIISGSIDALIETWSESTGDFVNKILGVPGDITKGIAKKALKNVDFSDWGKAMNAPMMKILRKGGFNGFLGEMGEEFIGNATRSLVGTLAPGSGQDPEALKNFAQWEQLLVTAGSFAPMTIFGIGTSSAQYGLAKRKLANAQSAFEAMLREASYTEDQTKFIIDELLGSTDAHLTPERLVANFSPLLRELAFNDRFANNRTQAMQSAVDFMWEIARYRTFDGVYHRQEEQQRNDMLAEIQEGTGREFWTTRLSENAGLDGTAYETDEVRAVEFNDGRVAYVLGGDGVNNTVVYNDGQTGFLSEEQLNEGKANGSIVSDATMGLNDYLTQQVARVRMTEEEQRMFAERNSNIGQLRAQFPQDATIELGTTEAPIQGVVRQQTPNGVIVESPAGISQLTWEELGRTIGVEVNPQTDAQMEEEAINNLEIADLQRRRERERRRTERNIAAEAALEAEQMLDQAENEGLEKPIPMKADGTVDQTAFWNESPARWAQWKTEQRQDGGAYASTYIQNAINILEGQIAESEAAFLAESDFDAKDAIEQTINQQRARLAELQGLAMQYAPSTAPVSVSAEATAEQTQPSSETSQPAAVMADRQKFELDAEYQRRLSLAKALAEKEMILKEYFEAISAGSMEAVVMNKQNYKQVMKDMGCDESAIEMVTNAIKFAEEENKAVDALHVNDKIFIVSEYITSIEGGRVSYVHERQHNITKNRPELVQRILSLGLGRETMQKIVRMLSGSEFYEKKSDEVLADEILSFTMEIAYTFDEFSVTLSKLGIPIELINLINEINDEQRKDFTLVNARRNANALDAGQRDSGQNDRDSGEVSGGILGQEGVRPSEDSERGTEAGESGEPATGGAEASEEGLQVPVAEVDEEPEEKPEGPDFRVTKPEDNLSDETKKELADKGLVMDGGAIMSDDYAELKHELGYETPIERNTDLDDLRFSYGTRHAHIANYLQHPEAEQRVVNLLERLAERLSMNELVFGVISKATKHTYGKKLPGSVAGPLRSNVEYIITFDLDTSCPRTFQYLNLVKRIERRIGRPLTRTECIQLIEMMRMYGQQIPCVYCYAENKRQALKQYYTDFIEARHGVLSAATDEEALEHMYGHTKEQSNDPKIALTEAAYNVFVEWRKNPKGMYNPTIKMLWNQYTNDRNSILTLLDTMLADKGISIDATDAKIAASVAAEFGVTNAKAKKVIEEIVAEWKWDVVEGKEHDQFTPVEEDDWGVNERALEVWRDMTAYAKSASSAKSVIRYTPYTDELKEISQEDKDYINGMGGVRMHSSNDFRIDYVFDYFQFMADMALYKMFGHTYTKSPEFVRIFGNSGYKINMSIAAYQDENGKIRPNADEGFDWEEAKALRLSFPNAGTMLMATSDEQIQMALDSDWIDMCIPFHHSGLPKAVWYNMRMWQDYTSIQKELFLNSGEMKDALKADGVIIPKKAKADEIANLYNEHFNVKVLYDKKGKRIRPHFLPGPTVVDGHNIPGHNNDHQRYLDLCREYGVKPRFAGMQVRDNSPEGGGRVIDVTEHPRYMIFIKETARTDSPQTAIQFNFDEPSEALGGKTPMEYAFDELEARAMAESELEGGPVKDIYNSLNKDQFGIADQFIGSIIKHKNETGEDYPLDYITPESREWFLVQRKALEEAFKDVETIPYHRNEYDEQGNLTENREGVIDLVEEARKADLRHRVVAEGTLVPGHKKGQPMLSDAEMMADVSFRITAEQDKAYMDAVKAGDMETAQRMVIEAARLAMPNTKVVDENGNPKVVYHGSTAMFTIFDKSRIGSATGTADGRGFYFTTDRDYALGYKTPDGQLFEVFLNIEKPLSYDKKTITKAQLRKILKEADKVEYEQEGEHYMLSNYANYNDVGIDGAVNEGANLEYDYADNDVELVGSLIGGSGSFDLIMDAVKKVTGKSGMIAPKDNGTIHYVVTDPAGIKSAEPVTYDDKGNVIPLSERFNPENEDIRFRVTEEQRDEVQFRVISDALYEEMDDMIESLVGASFFRRVEGEFDLGKKVKNFAEFADLITIIKNNDNYISTGSSLLGFFSSHTDQHFPLLLSVDDKALRKQAEADLKEALSQIDDTYILFYIKEAWKAHKNGLAQARLGVKPNATTKFNKAIDARIEEIRAGRVKGTSFNFKKQEVSLDEIDTIFKQLNTNEELAVLHDKVMDLAKRFGIKPQFAAIRGAAEGESLGDKVRYDYRAFNSPAISDERKANIITHELIHSVTSYAFYLDDYMPNALTPEMREAINILREVYYAIRRDSSFKDEYGASSVEEMVAELSNTAFREKLKEKSLYQRILDAILKLFGVVKEDSAYNAANEALTYIIENYDENAFNLYARQAARSQEYSKWYNSEDVRFRMSNENQAIFVSNAARAVEGIKQEKATPEQWLKMLEKAGGLKAGEDKWMGLSDWLKASDKKTLTKQEVLDFINEHMIVIEEQHYEEDALDEEALWYKYEESEEGVDAINYQMQMDAEAYAERELADSDLEGEEWDQEYERLVSDYIEDDLFGSARSAAKDAVRDLWMEEEAPKLMKGASREINSTRINYTTTGLDDLHEIALTVPTIESWDKGDNIHFGDAGDGRAVAWIRFGETTIYNVVDKAGEIGKAKAEYLAYTDSLKEKYDIVGYGMNTLDEKATAEEKETYSAMFGKINELQKEHGKKTSANKRVLVIDEIQSKRHQEGRDRGYLPNLEKEYEKKEAIFLDAQDAYVNYLKETYNISLGTASQSEVESLRAKDAKLQDLWEIMKDAEGDLKDVGRRQAAQLSDLRVPDAPFDKNWHELAMKRMLRYAAENGYDVIAWTKGEQQAERYNIGSYVSSIEAQEEYDGNRDFGFYMGESDEALTVTVDENGTVVRAEDHLSQAVGRPLADLVGKEMAVKMMQMEEYDVLEDTDLKVGNEGMKGFYDKMLPAFMNKYGKKWGIKVEDIDLSNLENGLTMHSVPVTEEMKSSVMEGQVMFRTTAITPEVQEEMDAIHASAIVMGNFMKAPNGKDTNLTEEQWLMVRTKSFKSWFGDWIDDPENASKIVDENGEPKVVYHGSGMTFTVFDKQKSDKNNELGAGFYFTDNPDVADLYTRSGFSDNEERYVRRAREIFNQKGSERGLANEYESVEYFDFAEDHLENYGFLDESVETDYEEAFEKAYDEMFSQKNVMPVFLNIRKPYMVEGVSPYNAKELARQEDVDGFIDNEFSSRHEFIRKHTENKNFSQYVAFYPSQIKSATDNNGEFSEGEGDIRFSIRTKSAPKKTGIGYKVFYLKDGKLYPPMVANQGGVDTPMGVWLDAEEGTRAGVSKTGRPKVKQGGKGTQGGSGTLAYRPGWHLGEVPYAIQFNRKDENGDRTLFPADFVWAEVEYANDVDYQDEAMSYGMNANGKFQHSLAGLPKLPTDGSYRYRTNPNPETDPWIITGAMKVNRLLTPSEVDQMVIDAGREPQKRQEGAVTDAQIEALNKELGLVEEEEEVSFRTTGTPTEDVVAEGVSLSPAQLASLAGDIFAALPEEGRKKITDGLNGNILGLQDAILQIPTSLATKENWNDEDRQMAEVIAEQMTKVVGIEMTRPFSASEALWTLYNAVNKSTNLVSEASRALVRRNLGFDSQTLEMEKEAKDGVRFRTVGNASANASASMYNRGAANVWTRLKEVYVDMHASVEKLVKAIEKRSGKKAEGFENILMALNQQSSKGLAAMEAYEQKFLNEMFDEIRWIMDKTDFKYEDIVRYVILKHGLERNEKMAQRDAKAHYQEIYDDIIAKIKGMNPAQKRTYLTNAQLRDADAKAELARLQGVNTSALTPDQLRDHKKELAKAKKEASEAAEHLVKAQKVATLTEQDAQDELDKIFKKIERGTDSVYKEMRKNDYSGISSMFYDTLGVDRKNYATEEEYQSALMQAKADKYDNLGDIEGAAQMEVTLFENTIQTNNLWKSINKATKETLRQQYEANMISKDQYLNLRDMFEFYVPLRGFADNTAEDMYTYYRRPNSTGYTKPILGAEGRKTEAESPFGWIAAMAGSAIASNVKNEAKLALYYFVANRPDNGIATLSRTWFVHTPGDVDANGKKIFRPAYPPFNQDLSTDAAKQAYEDWQEQMRDLQKQGLAYEAGQRLNLGNSVVNISDTNKPEHIVNVKVGGKDYTIVINGNPRAAQAINGDLNIETNDTYNNVLLGPWLRWLSSVNTSYNPEFWATNMMRDVAFTIMAVSIKGDPNYRRKFFKNYRKALKVVSMVVKNEKGTLGNSYIEQQYKDFVKYGGVTGFTQIKDSETWEKEIEKYLKNQDADTTKAIKAVKDGLHAFHRFGESLEQVSRFAAFLTAVETGKSINEAINDAKEITVNFNRKGSGKRITIEEAKLLTKNNGQRLNDVEAAIVSGISYLAPIARSTIMFFNASVQALNAWFKLWKANKLRSLSWVIGYATVGVINALIHALVDDDDEYLDIPQYERRSSLMLGGNGVYFKWALPQEMSAFYALGELSVETIFGRNPHQSAAAEAVKVVGDMLPVNIAKIIMDKGGWVEAVPSQVKPFLELIRNEDYKGDVIFNEQKWLSEGERERTANWESAYKGTGRTYIEISKLLNNLTDSKDLDEAGWINIHPESLEHVVESMAGGVGRTVSKLFNFITAAINPEEDVTVKQTPFLNRFLTINDERYKNVHVNDVYDYYAAEAEHAISLQKQYTKDRNSDALKDLRSSEEYKWARIYSKYKKPIKKYQEAIRAADTTNERMELMKQQDELKRKMIKEISDL